MSHQTQPLPLNYPMTQMSLTLVQDLMITHVVYLNGDFV